MRHEEFKEERAATYTWSKYVDLVSCGRATKVLEIRVRFFTEVASIIDQAGESGDERKVAMWQKVKQDAMACIESGQLGSLDITKMLQALVDSYESEGAQDKQSA